MKRLVDLTAQDLRDAPVWRYEGGAGAEALVEPSARTSLSREDDEIFLAATEFTLGDGTPHFGYCFPADDSGLDYLQPVVLTDSGAVHFWFEGPALPETLTAQWRALGKTPAAIFPVRFRCVIPVDGQTVASHIPAVGTSQNLSSGPPAPEIDAAAVETPEADRVPTARPVQARRNTGPVEKRTARRRKAEMVVEFSQGDLRGTGVTRDVSPRGVFVRSPRIPGTGPMLRLRVNLPGGRTLVLEGRVVRDTTALKPAAPSPGFGLRLAREWPDYTDLFPNPKRDK